MASLPITWVKASFLMANLEIKHTKSNDCLDCGTKYGILLCKTIKMVEITQHIWDIYMYNLWSSTLLVGDPYLQICIRREMGRQSSTADQQSEFHSRPQGEIIADQMQVSELAGMYLWFSCSGHRIQQPPTF